MKKNELNRRKFLLTSGAAMAGLAVTQQGCTGSRAAGADRPILENVDVLVVGGGPAGIGAALGAARKGVKTLIIENHSFFGGIAAWSLGMQINQLRPTGVSRSVVHEQFIQKISGYGDQAVRFGTHEIWCNVEYMKVAVLDALEEVGCRYLLHARAVDAVVKNNRILGVVIATKQGLKEIRAKVVVDCTGDADVAYFAGAETMIDPNDLMPLTLALLLTNLDTGKIPASDVGRMISGRIHDARQKYPLNPSGFVETEQFANSRSWWVNHAGTADLGRIDVTDPYEDTRAAAFSNRQAIQMIQSIRESDNPGLQQIELAGTGPQASVRESRRVKGVYVITEEDALAGRVFDDTIAWRSGYLDLGGQKNDKRSGKMMVHDVPYRSILPEKLDGLLMAGRCISTTHVATAAGKSMGNCMATGHAAGLAAAMCTMKTILPRDLKVMELQDALRADGVDLAVKVREQGRM
jgi:hypothetical protein